MSSHVLFRAIALMFGFEILTVRGRERIRERHIQRHRHLLALSSVGKPSDAEVSELKGPEDMKVRYYDKACSL